VNESAARQIPRPTGADARRTCALNPDVLAI
jgi:hypothetical protein